MRRMSAFLTLEAGVARSPAPTNKSAIAKLGNGKPRIRRELRRSEKRHQQAANKDKEERELAVRDFARPQGPARQEEVPIFFVTGAGKSGTTWFRRMLDHHPEILCRGEGWFFGRNVRWEERKHVKTDAEGRMMPYATLYNALAEDEYLRMWLERTPWTRDGDVEEHLADLTREAVRLFLTKKLSRSAKRVVGDKSPLLSAGVVGEIGAIMPEAKVIHVIRDGRDRAVSWMHHIWNRQLPTEEGGNLEPEERDKRDRYREAPEAFLASGESIFTKKRIRTASLTWALNVGSARRQGLRLLGNGRYAEVRYEDLLERPEQELRRIFRFLGVSAGKRVVKRSVMAEGFERRSGGRERGEEDSTSARRKGVAGDWKNVFTERDKAIFKEVAGELLIELGYEKDNSW
jgi:hypothetical protein